MDSFQNWVRETSVEFEEKLSRALKPEEIIFLEWVKEQLLNTEAQV
ncbi:hypothetical protein JMA_29820 [Jeotgalibacillus malaysiensis]|uniref:Uncharacterized protein n=1 Tax=Jeotgalibacillus malaysiensis TaxID=1508404 RepID=A0A0B5AWA1_9BACL|nr:hypothetical protein [Jeotgalibacillus malaysiensis]AJD92299.1 hypothetical protein JMA_29820 [Jeotgalibacillus malaysiensis]